MDKNFSGWPLKSQLHISRVHPSLIYEWGSRASLFEYQSVGELQQTDAGSSWRTFIWTADKIRHSTASDVRDGCAGTVFCCLKLMYHCLCLQTSAGGCQEEQPDGSFPVGGVWQLGLQDLTGHSAGESSRRGHYHPAQTCHGGGYVHVKTQSSLILYRSKICGQ